MPFKARKAKKRTLQSQTLLATKPAYNDIMQFLAV